MTAEMFAAHAGISTEEAERILAEAAEEKANIDKEINTQMEQNINHQMEQNTKQLSIRVKAGTAERELTFPVPADMVAWMESLEMPGTPESNDNPMSYTVEGSRRIQISISLFDMSRRF